MNTYKCIIKKIKSGKFKNQFRFNLHGGNGKIVGTSGSESYYNLKDAIGTIEKYFPNFTIVMPNEDVRQRNHKEPVKAPDKATTQKAKEFVDKVIEKALKEQEDTFEEQLRGSY